jgi:hypothetical protein
VNKRQRKKYEKKHPEFVWYGQLHKLARIRGNWQSVTIEIPKIKSTYYFEDKKK